MKQKDTIINDLLTRAQFGAEGLTQLDALLNYGVGRLASRIHDLKCDGWMIKAEKKPVVKADGSKTEVAFYSIDPENACWLIYGYHTTRIRAVRLPNLDTVVQIWKVGEWVTDESTRRSHRRIVDEPELVRIAREYGQANE